MSAINHVLLEVFCRKAILDPDGPCPGFCPTQGEMANYQCLFNTCKYVDFNSCENTLSYIGGASDEEYGIAIGQEDQLLLDTWKQIAVAKIEEAYDAYEAFRKSPGYLAHVSRMNMLSQMRAYCYRAFAQYANEYEEKLGITYVKFLFYEGLLYELEKLVDHVFPDLEEFLDAIDSAILSVARNTRTPNLMGTFLVEKEARRTREAFAEISPDCEKADISYRRVLAGEERDAVMDRLEHHFGFTGNYWYPLKDAAVSLDLLFVMAEVVKDRWNQILPYLAGRMYEFQEAAQFHDAGYQIMEVEQIDPAYDGWECAFCDKNFSWIIYFSHEGSVTFGGSIVGAVKEILKDRQELWDKMFW